MLDACVYLMSLPRVTMPCQEHGRGPAADIPLPWPTTGRIARVQSAMQTGSPGAGPRPAPRRPYACGCVPLIVGLRDAVASNSGGELHERSVRM